MAMGKRFDVVISHKDKSGKNRYTKVGMAFEGAKGVSIKLDPGVSISTPDGVWINLYEPRERDGAPRQANDSDDNIPF